MDLERLRAVQSARASFVEAANTNLPEAQKGEAEQLLDRFVAVAERMAKYVSHEHFPQEYDEGYVVQRSAARLVGVFEGPMPNVYVKFKYGYRLGGENPFDNQGGFPLNNHHEYVHLLRVEWTHAPDGVTANPSSKNTSVPIMTQYGEVFATEYIDLHDINMLKEPGMDDGMERMQEFHPSVRLALIEQSMDQYEAAPPSPYELREGLVKV